VALELNARRKSLKEILDMRILKLLAANSWLLGAVAFTSLAVFPACSVSVKDKNGNENSKVDIETPIGGIHVDENADARDTGLAVYPGARKKQKTDDGDEKSANVDISGFGFGLKVVALEYESDDPMAKLIAYYQDQLKKYGSVLQCHTDSLHIGKYNVGKTDSKELTCDHNDGGNTVELKAGTRDSQHIVSVEPEGKGSDFAIVWVRIRGKEGDI
jgi:hypothetical protein